MSVTSVVVEWSSWTRTAYADEDEPESEGGALWAEEFLHRRGFSPRVVQR